MDFQLLPVAAGPPGAPAAVAARGPDPLIVIPPNHTFRRINGLVFLVPAGAMVAVGQCLHASTVDALLGYALCVGVTQRPSLVVSLGGWGVTCDRGGKGGQRAVTRALGLTWNPGATTAALRSGSREKGVAGALGLTLPVGVSSSRLKVSTGGRYGSRRALQAPRVGGSNCGWGVAGEPGGDLEK